MALTAQVKTELIKKYGKSDKDTGSTEAQVAMLSKRIADLTEHLKLNKKDFACQRGLTILVGQRRRLLNYYKNNQSAEAYKKLLTALKLRK